MTPPLSQTRLNWPADRFYWAVLETSNLPKSLGGHTRNQLGFLFEAHLPVPIDQVHAQYIAIPGAGERSQYLACGAPHESLHSVAGAVTLSPESIPEFVECGEAIDPSRLNLLTGKFTPPAVERLKRRSLMLAAAFIIAVTAILLAGMERRRQTLAEGAQAVNLMMASLIQRVVGLPGAGATGSRQPPELLMTAELRNLQQTRSPEVHGLFEEGAAVESLSSLLAVWPGEIHAVTQSLLATDKAISLRVEVPTSADAERFVAALQELQGWSSSQPSVNASGEGVTIQATMAKEGTSR